MVVNIAVPFVFQRSHRCVRACVRACVRVCVRACVCACLPAAIGDNEVLNRFNKAGPPSRSSQSVFALALRLFHGLPD